MKISLKMALLAGIFTLAASQASAAVMVLGSSRAQSCYQAAEHERATNDSIANCQRALREDPLTTRDHTATLVNLGILYFYRDQYDLALTSFDRAIANDPNEPEAYLNKAITLLRRDESGTQAVPLFTMALDMGTRKPALAFYGRGLAHELDADLTAAYHDIQRATVAEPSWDVPARDLARFIVEPAR